MSERFDIAQPQIAGEHHAPAARFLRVRRAIAGRVLSSQDFKAGELVTHAQSCIWIAGYSELAKVLNAGKDPHAAFAATILGVSYEEFLKRKKEPRFKDTRQASKPPDFGFPGGMAEVRLVLQAREGGPDTPWPGGPSLVKDDNGDLVPGFKGLRFCLLMGVSNYCGRKKTTSHKDETIPPTCVECIDCATRLRHLWRVQWPENKPVFDYVSRCIDRGMVISGEALDRWPWLKDRYRPGQQLNPGEVMQHHSGIIRGGLDFCSCANGFFQALLARISKLAHRICVRECYDRTIRVPDMLFWNSKRSAYAGMPSPLYGSRIPLFAHDELLGDHPLEMSHDGPMRISEVMRDCMRWVCPDLADAAEAEPTTMFKWDKRASKVMHRGRLVPWTPEHDEKTCSECKAAA